MGSHTKGPKKPRDPGNKTPKPPKIRKTAKGPGPTRAPIPTHNLTYRDAAWFRHASRRYEKALAKTQEEHFGYYYPLKAPTTKHFQYIHSLIPSYQRAFKHAQYKVLLRELRDDRWCEHNGDFIGFYLAPDGKYHLFNGQTRTAAFYTFLKEGGEPPKHINIYFTNDPEAYVTCDGGTTRSLTDVGVLRKRVRLSTSTTAGILYEKNNFTPYPKMSKSETDLVLHSEEEIVDFIRSLPQSGGNTPMLSLGGVYSGAIRAWRVYDIDDVFPFFRALIARENWLGGAGANVMVPQLQAAIVALDKYKGQNGGTPGKVFAAYISMMAFVYWMENKKLDAKKLAPPIHPDPKKQGMWGYALPSIPIPRPDEE